MPGRLIIMSLIPFYLGQAPDQSGRLITELWSFTHDQLEEHHDFIQWLFPLEVPSPVNRHAPTLSTADIEAFRARPRLRDNLLRSLDLMLNFYGLEREAPLNPALAPEIVLAPNFQDRSDHWLAPGNHNHLRLTRILHCLELCGCHAEAAALLRRLELIADSHPRAVTAETLTYWRHAVAAE
jgi:hypothetical protein